MQNITRVTHQFIFDANFISVLRVKGKALILQQKYLQSKVYEALNLSSDDEVYCVVSMEPDHQQHRTQAERNGVWNEEFAFELTHPPKECQMKITLLTKDNVNVGELVVPLTDLQYDTAPKSQWLQIGPKAELRVEMEYTYSFSKVKDIFFSFVMEIC